MKRITKKEIVNTLRTYNPTRICALYKRVYGCVPMKEDAAYHFTYLDGYKIYQWAEQYATGIRMDRRLYHLLCRVSHHWNYSAYDMCYVYSKHGEYEPLPKQRVVEFLVRQCQNPTSNYAKRPMMGYTNLYFCSPAYGHKDYNKWCALPIAGNERFCETVIKYANRYFS